jgi:hypothetical protein
MSNDESRAHEQLVRETIDKTVRHVGAVYQALLHRDPDAAEMAQHANAILRGRSPMDFFESILTSEERRSHAHLYVAPGHFYSPVANPAELHHYVRAQSNAGPQVAGISIDRDRLIAMWNTLLPYLTTCPLPEKETDGFHFFFDNRAFGFDDAIVLQAMIRHYMPRRMIEIGSGYCSACSVDTIDTFLHGECRVTFIEPYPERLRLLLGARIAGTRVLDIPVQQAPPGIFEELEAGDILFIDSTHVLRTGSDVCFELFEILPRLASGVAVHIHDMFWPFEYPGDWILKENRSWNELYAVRAFLTGNDAWEITFFNDYFAKFERPLIERTFPRFGNAGGSLWLERR